MTYRAPVRGWRGLEEGSWMVEPLTFWNHFFQILATFCRKRLSQLWNPKEGPVGVRALSFLLSRQMMLFWPPDIHSTKAALGKDCLEFFLSKVCQPSVWSYSNIDSAIAGILSFHSKKFFQDLNFWFHLIFEVLTQIDARMTPSSPPKRRHSITNISLVMPVLVCLSVHPSVP